MTHVARRTVVAGLAASLAIPVRAQTPTLGQALNAAAAGDPDTGLRTLAAFDATALTGAARLDLLTARAGLTIDARLAARFPSGHPGRSPYRVTPRSGAWQAARPTAKAIDRDTALLAADQASGVILPRAALDSTIAALTRTIPRNEDVAAALARQIVSLTRQRGAAPRPGLSHLPDGAALYALYLQRSTGTIDPTGALARLEREHRRLATRADRIFRTLGVPGPSTGARYVVLWRDSTRLYPDSDAGRAKAIADMRTRTAAARARIPAQFGPVPAFCLDATVRALSPAEIAANRQGYREVPTPGHPGAYIVDLKDIRRRPAWTLPSVVAHELLPGHMLQLGLETLMPPHPLRLDYASAFVEGWGIYAETLAPYPDARDALGHIHWLIFRVTRAIVDLRIHLHGWSRDQARAALVAWLGEPAYFAPFDTELDRITLEPASRVAEAMAWLAIADATRGLTGAALIARHRAILADGRKRIDAIA